MMRSKVRWLPSGAVVVAVLASLFVFSPPAQAATSCGGSGGHTICVSVPDVPLSGATTVTITNSPNSGTLIATWVPSGASAILLITEFAPAPQTNDYSFVWPTQKYLDASGVLQVQAGSPSNASVSVPVTLSNGNVSDFQHSPADWANYLPNPSWTNPTDPVVAAVGDGASNEVSPNNLASSIAAAGPPVFLYLGDIYETGTFTENLNHYGQNSMDGGPGTLWGAMGTITQPAMGDHEAANSVAWQDYFHGRPLYTSFEFANVLFLDLASSRVSMAAGSAQYNYVQSILTNTSSPPPPCVVAYFQNPVLAKSKIKADRTAMWSLLTHNGGDLVLNGNSHTMIQYKPLNDQLQLPSAGQDTMVELIDGAGGHSPGGPFTSDARVEWSKGNTPGAVWISLVGAANGGTPTSLSWGYKNASGTVLHTGTRDCGVAPAPVTSISGFSPTSGPIGTSVTINGSNFTGASDVTFGGVSAGLGNFTVDSDSQITATVPANAVTGPISVTTPLGTGTSQAAFTVTGPVLTFGPDADTFIKSDAPTKNFGAATSLAVINGAVVKDSFLKFTVSGVGSGSVAGATLRLYCTGGSDVGGLFYRVADNTWQESTVTWNTAPAADASSFASLAAVASGTWYEVDVGSLVTGDGTYSLEITSPSANGVAYSSKEGTAGFAPQLVVTLL